MATGYSVNGYLNAVLRRSSSTLLVEGVQDKQALHRLAAEREPSREIFIDQVGMLADPSLATLGAKQRIAVVWQRVNEIKATFKKLEGSFATLVDREWDGIALDATALISGWQPPQQQTNSYLTVGHSIENYHFHQEWLVSYLKFEFPDHCHVTVPTAKKHFKAFLAFAGAYSFVAANRTQIGRLSGLLNSVHLSFDGTVFRLNAAFDAAAVPRGVTDPAGFRQEVDQLLSPAWLALSEVPHAQWLLHGHLGGEALFSALGNACMASGVASDVVEAIVNGHKRERCKHWMDWLSVKARERDPLNTVVDWLVSP